MRKLIKTHFKYSGFTLIEMLVVIAIIGIVSAIFFVNQRSGQPQYLINQGAQKLASDLRRAQNMAMSGSKINGNYYGYGIYLQSSGVSYVLYGEKTDTGSNSTVYNAVNPAQDDIIESVSLPQNVSVNSISFASGQAHILFKPPEPATTISDGTDSTKTDVSIVLKVLGSSLTKTIHITNAGLVEVQ